MNIKESFTFNFLYESPFCVNFIEFAQKSGTEHSCDTAAVFCDIFLTYSDILWVYAFYTLLCATGYILQKA